jgi:hypothetical protein
MIARAGHHARLPIAAIAVLALLAFIAFSVARPTLAPTPASVASPTTPAVTQTLAPRPVPADANGDCAAGTAYVTGDLVGDASPAEVFSKLCPN